MGWSSTYLRRYLSWIPQKERKICLGLHSFLELSMGFSMTRKFFSVYTTSVEFWWLYKWSQREKRCTTEASKCTKKLESTSCTRKAPLSPFVVFQKAPHVHCVCLYTYYAVLRKPYKMVYCAMSRFPRFWSLLTFYHEHRVIVYGRAKQPKIQATSKITFTFSCEDLHEQKMKIKGQLGSCMWCIKRFLQVYL